MLFELSLIVLLAVLNGFFALSEMALMTSRPSRLKHLERRHGRENPALKMIAEPERFLATVQVFITLIGIGTGTTLGVRFGADIEQLLHGSGLSWLEPYATPVSVALSVSAITFFNMLLGELLPKRIALVDPERIAMAVAWPMRIMTWIAAPFAYVLIALTRLLLRIFRLDRSKREQVSEEEIRLLVAEGAEQGVIDSDEHNMVNRVLRLGDRTVDSLMTPRIRICWLDADASVAENLATMRATPYSRYPVYRGGEHDVLGMLEVKRLVGAVGGARVDLFAHLSKPLYVPSTARAFDLLEQLRDAGAAMALVVDEYGDIEGLVTSNDVFGAVVGATAAPRAEPNAHPIMRRDDGSWLVDGGVATEDLRELLDLDALPQEDEHDFHTAAGMAMAQFGRIPQPGEHFDWRGYRFEIVDLDGARIDKLLISPVDGDARPGFAY
jgi:putative hemolysin